MQSYIGFVAFVILFIIFNREKSTPAYNFIIRIPIALFTKELSNRLSVGSRPNSKNKAEPLEIPVTMITKDKVSKLPFYSYFKAQWSCFLAGIISMFICIPFGVLGLTKQANLFCIIGIISIFIIMRFAGMTASNSLKVRKFSLFYALTLSILFYIILSNCSLYSIDPRPIILSEFNIEPRIVNIALSFSFSYIVYSLCFPLLKQVHVVHSIKTLSMSVAKWEICLKVFKEVNGIKRDLIVGFHSIIPIPTIVFIICRKFLLRFFDNDLVLDIIYLTIEALIAVIYLWLNKIQLRIILTDVYELLTEFEKDRSYEKSKAFQVALNRSISMIPTYLMALAAYPMLILLNVALYAISFFMSGLAMEISRIVPLFIIAAMEVIMSTNKLNSLYNPNL